MVEEPVQAVKRNVLVDAFEHVERPRDRLVIGGVKPPRPTVLREDADDLLKLALHFRRHIRPRLPEILKVCGREHQHLAAAIVTEKIVALFVLRRLRPIQKVLLLAFRLLREQIVGEPDGELALLTQLADDFVILGVVLKAPARVDRAGHAKPVEFPHEMPRGIELIIERQLGALGQRRIEDTGIGFRKQKAGWIAARIADDLSAGGFCVSLV